MKKVLAISLFVLMGLFSLAACSSGISNGSGGKKKTYDYKAALYGADENVAFSSLLGLNVDPGTAIANNTSGTLKYKVLQSPDGSGDGGTASLTVDEYGFANMVEAGEDPMFGSATPDASVFFSIDTIQAPGAQEANLIVGTNRTSGMSTSDVNGLYTCAMLLSDGVTNSVSSFQIIMNGSGSFIGGPAVFGTYSVSGDGSMTFTGGIGGGVIKGATRNGGDVMFVSLNDPDGLGFALCVDDEETHTVSDLSGNYRFAGMGVPNTPGPPYAFMGEAFFDGSGAGSKTFIAAPTGFINASARQLQADVAYTVNAGDLMSADGDSIVITASRDFFMVIDDDDSDGSTELIVGTRYTPPGFPTEYLGVSLGGDAISNLTASVNSINTISNNIAPGESGTLGIRALIDTDGSYLSETGPFIVNSEGFIIIPGSTQPAWGFVNTSAKTFLLATTDQTTESYVNLMPGVMAGSGLTNTTATMTGIYNCAAIAEEAAPSIDLDFTGDGELSVGGYPFTYGLTGGGLLTIHDGPDAYYGMVQTDTKMVVAILDALYICMKPPVTLSIDGLVGTYVFGTFNTVTGATPDVGAEIGTVTITNSTDLDGFAVPTTLYNSTGAVISPTPQNQIPLFLNTTTNSFEIEFGSKRIPLWVSDDYNLFVIGQDQYPFEQLIFGIRN